MGSRVIQVAGLALMSLWAMPGGADVRVGAPASNDFSNHYIEGFASKEGIGKHQTLSFYGARGAQELDQHFHVRGSIAVLDAAAKRRGGDRVNPALRGERLTVGGGFNTPIQTDLDLQLTAELVYQSVRARRGDNRRDLGLTSRLGVRHQTHDVVQLSGGVRLNAVHKTRAGVYGEALLRVASDVDVGVEVFTEGSREAASLLLRYNF